MFSLQSEWAIPAFAFPVTACTHLPTTEGWKAELAWVVWANHFSSIEEPYGIVLQDSNKPEALVTSSKLYVTGIKDGMDDVDLREYFSRFGQIDSVELITDHNTGRPRGFAFITFSDYDAVDKLVSKWRDCCPVYCQNCRVK